MAVLLICCCQTFTLHGFNLWGCSQPSCCLAETTMSVPDPESSAKICMRWPNLFYFYTTLHAHTHGRAYVCVCVSVCLVLKFWRAPQKCRPTKFKPCMPIYFPLTLCYCSCPPSSCSLCCFLLFLLRCLMLIYMLIFQCAKQQQKTAKKHKMLFKKFQQAAQKSMLRKVFRAVLVAFVFALALHRHPNGTR